MAITQERKMKLSKNIAHETDTGSPEVQIAVLTAEIALNEHLREHKKTTIHVVDY